MTGHIGRGIVLLSVALAALPHVNAAAPAETTPATALAQARTTGAPVEVPALRTERERRFVNPDGSWTLEQHVEPVRVRQRDGSWADVDTRLRRDGDRLRPVAAAGDVSFSADGGGQLAELRCSRTGSSAWSSPASCEDGWADYDKRVAEANHNVATGACATSTRRAQNSACADVGHSCLLMFSCDTWVDVPTPLGNLVPSQQNRPSSAQGFVSFGFCIYVCYGINLTPDGPQATVGGVGSLGVGMSIGVTSAPAREQSPVSGQACLAIVVGFCGMGGKTATGGAWGGGALQLGTGWYLGPSASMSLVDKDGR